MSVMTHNEKTYAHVESSPVSVKSPLRYPGGKFRAREILMSYVPEGTERILSPFMGGGSFELFAASKGLEVFAYDAFRPLSNFWEWLLLCPLELAREVDSLHPTSKEEFLHFQSELKRNEHRCSTLREAAWFFVVNRSSFSGATLSGGFSQESSVSRFTPSSIETVRNFNAPNLSFSRRDFKESLGIVSLQQMKPDLLFLDPPYKMEFKKNSLYGVGGSLHRMFDHESLCGILRSVDVPFILTYNDSEEIREMYAGFSIVEERWSYGMSASKKSAEIVISNI